MFVEISLEKGKDNPQRIFESLNLTGLELSQADLIRNFILMDLSRNEQERVFNKYWSVIEQNTLSYISGINCLSDFVRDYLTIEKTYIK